jgi:hypothetical protein
MAKRSLQPKLTAAADGPSATLPLQVTNAGERAGAEVVQAYVRPVKPPGHVAQAAPLK